jgi:ATP-dependent Lhr-like helicase
VPPTAAGRWSAVPAVAPTRTSGTEWGAAVARQLLARHGVVTRETAASEAVAGGFSAIYQVLKAMEDAGRVRRGYFVAGLGGAQFAMPAALDMLRSMRDAPEVPRTVAMAATDLANPYGAVVKWPQLPGATDGRAPTRIVGARVVLVDGAAAAYIRRGEGELLLFAPDAEPGRSTVTREVARMLRHLAASREPRGMLIAEINGEAAVSHPAARRFIEEGFAATAMGLQCRISGTAVAAFGRGGQTTMAEPRNQDELEQEDIRDDASEEDIRNRSSEEDISDSASEDIDPDSAEADIDRDDSVKD